MNRKIALIAAIAAITIIVVIGTYYVVLPPPPTTETPPTILSHTHLIETDENTSISFYKVIGVIRNNLDTSIESVNVTATFFDAEGTSMAVRNASSELKIIEPKQNAPFEVYLLLEPTKELPDRYELTLSYVKTSKGSVAGLEIVERTWTVDETTGYHILTGEIQNTGQQKAEGVKILCTYYDADGNVIAVSRTYIRSTLYGGEKAAFEISSEPHKISSDSDFELLIVAQRYDPLPIVNYVLFAILAGGFFSFIVYMKKRRGW